MIHIHDRDVRGHTQMGWLDSRHTFSFGSFSDPSRMGFRSLRVINDDRVIPGTGFGTHGHKDMEIITYVMSGSLAHRDSLGTGSLIKPGEIQKMSAGSGIEHSEFNGSDQDPVHFLQIWIVPDKRGIAPAYEQKIISPDRNCWTVIGNPEGSDNAIRIQQDVKMMSAYLDADQKITYAFDPKRYGFLQVAKGQISLNGETLKQGDGAQISDEIQIDIIAQAESDLLLFDMA
ncbi:MAG: pirin family protein [Alphaproteobacteria bacterium]|nr:pirin family protein [Alphaproteobacteria bacterium]